MNKLLIAILFLVVPLSALADETECTFPVGMVKQVPPPNAAAVAAYQWDTGYDKEYIEHIQTLRILYKNGDIAVIQHRHCVFYSLEINYFRNSLTDDLDAKAIATLMAGLYTQYVSVPKKVTFAKPLAESIASTFKKQNFDRKKHFVAELPEADASSPYPDLKLSYEIVYKFHKADRSESISGIFSSMTRLEMILWGGGG